MKKLLVSIVALMSVVSLAAQDLTTIYNDAAAAYTAKDYATAADAFAKVIATGAESADPDAAQIVATAKATLPKCYFQLGGRAVQGQNFEAALPNFVKSAELAELYGDNAQMAKSSAWVNKIYQAQGGAAFNNKDYAKAAEVFAKLYAAAPNNTELAMNLAMSYSELAMANDDMSQYEKGMDIYESVAAMKEPQFTAVASKATEMMTLYTNNMVAKMQKAGNTAGIIAMADAMLAKNPANAVAQKVRVQAYSDKKDYAKVIELGSAAAEAQTAADDKSFIYLQLGAAYNAKEMKPQAIAAFQKVTAGPAVASAKKALADLAQ
ncbi:MAG: hypothetical protein RSB29_05935 [Alistipes sp.]